MTFAECAREQDVVDAVTTGQWPGRCGNDLTMHVASCEGCRDLVAVLDSLGGSWAGARADAQVPASGMVWWRAQMRARQEAARAAARPITVVQGVAGVTGLALALAGLVAVLPWLASWLASARGFLALDVPDIALQGGWLLAGGVATVLVLASLALYVVVAED